MALARTAYQWLAWLTLATMPVIFFLAGLGTFGREDIEPHKVLGSIVAVAAVLLLLLAIVGAIGLGAIIRSVVLVVLALLQSVWTRHDLDPRWLGSFHVLGALLIAFALYDMANRAGMPWRRAQPMRSGSE